MQNAKFKETFEKEYQEFALQELIASMAKVAGLHPNAVQNLKSGKTSDRKSSISYEPFIKRL